MPVYYNECHPWKASGLRQLMAEKLIAEGDVDERSIVDVRPDDLRGYRQCHFFAGSGVWSYALRCAGWPDDREVWTGSPPCQPFSVVGKRKAFHDERHLWAEWFLLIQARRPVVCFGEQTASIDGLAWFDLVQADMDRAGYAVGGVDLCAAGVGAPHVRQRLYFVAEAVGELDDAASARRAGTLEEAEADSRAGSRMRLLDAGCEARGVADADDAERRADVARGHVVNGQATGRTEGDGQFGAGSQAVRPGPVNGYWGTVDWLLCKDGRWRPTESLDVALVDGLADHLGYRLVGGRYSLAPLLAKTKRRKSRLRAYGDAIVAQLAQAFIETYMSLEGS